MKSKQLPLPGLEPDNVLAFLAMAGLLTALEKSRAGWRPRCAWSGTPPGASLHLDVEATEDEVAQAADEGLRAFAHAYEFGGRDKLDFTAAEFRAYARDCRHDRDKALVCAALSADDPAAADGDPIKRTPLYLLAGQQTDFLGRLRYNITYDKPNAGEKIAQALFQRWAYEEGYEKSSLRWDPVEDRRYALQYGDPSDKAHKIGTVPGANRLASLGFTLYTCFPVSGGLATAGVTKSDQGLEINWPLPSGPAGLTGYRALLLHPDLTNEDAPLAHLGVSAVATARIYFSVQQYRNIGRARLR